MKDATQCTHDTWDWVQQEGLWAYADNQGYLTNYTYDAMDRVQTMTYPDNEAVTTTYNPMGLAKSLAGSATYVQNLDYNARSQPTTLSYGDGTATAYNYWGEGERPQSGTFRLWQIQATNGSTLLDVQYDYDLVGNVKWRYDSLSGLGNEALNFTYDHLDRLTGVSGAYSESYEYSGNDGKIGNLTKKGTINYTYGTQSASCPDGALSKPHAVVTAGTNTFCYDRNGNMVKRNGTTYTLTYDAENRLSGVSGGASASFVYDGDGKRVKATFGTTTTLYIGNHYELTTLYQEDFNDGVADGWTGYAGTWAVQNQAYRQSNTTHTNTNAYRVLTQNEPLVYQWTVTYSVGTQAGLYLFASSATNTERGNAYRVWQDASYVRIYESVNNTAYLRASFAAANAAGQTHHYRALYDSTTGKLQVWRDGTYLGSWTDSTRLTSGAYLSLRTTSTEARFDNLVVYRPVQYYYLAGQRVAMRKAGVAYSVVTDQLGSTSVTRNTGSGQVSAMRYYPWGTTRAGSLPTDYTFTGQKSDASTGLMYYGARYYDAYLNRWIQPDTIVPEPGNPQALNRYSYVYNNPLRYIDPSGRCLQESGGISPCTLLFEEIEIILHTDQPGYPNQNVFNRQIWIAAREAGISPTLVKAVVAAETGGAFDLNASSGVAVGLMQLLAPTARGEGLRVDDELDERYDSLKNLKAGARYLRQQYDAFKDATGEDRWKLAATAYTAGPGTVWDAQGYIQDATAGSSWYGRDPNTFVGVTGADATGQSPLSVAVEADHGKTRKEAIEYVNEHIANYINNIGLWLGWMRR